MNIRANILLRVYLAFGMIVLLAVAVLVRLGDVQFVEGNKWRAMADSLSTKYINVEAARGNIYSNDGSLLATSVPEYELRMDLYAGGIVENKVFYSKVDSLAMKLSEFFGDKTAKEYSRQLRTARADSARYMLLKRKINYQDLKMIRSFPLYNIGKYSGGLIAIQQNKRILPFKSLAARTIGYKNVNVDNGVGLEGAYGSYINGESGKRLVQRIAGGVWMPVNDEAEIAPKEGADIISTIDINMQDLAQSALEKQLIASNADHGTVILMEVQTGEVRAVANYTRESEGVYKEKFNYAIGGSQDPGSTFKLASYMALLEDNKVDTNSMVETGNGEYKVFRHTIRDSHGGIGTVTVKKAFEQSANTAIAKLVYTNYKDNPRQFTDHLYKIHMNERLGLQIPGETKPVIKNPSFKSWSGLSLAQMAYGYEMQITPLQILAFYNAIANDGKYIAPIFVKEIRRLGNPIEQFHARVISEQVASPKTVKKLQEMLESVVTQGTGRLMGSPFYRVAGKTGTAQVADGNKGYKAKRSYQASFCGYFPADKPKYAIMVSINGPKNGYYGATVAGPVFKEIADRIYASDIQMYNNVTDRLVGNTKSPEAKAGQSKAVRNVYNALGIKTLYAAKSAYFNTVDTSNGIVYEEYSSVKGMMPNVKGMGLKDALYLLGNAGLKTQVKGSGKVYSQSIPSGMKIGNGLIVQLELK
ncbi:cell division protein [Pedobacter antarcticus 4BY]|uniref:Cell division protein n=2 Tax=Pedobacter antarcticus TaxID=34086 RepID=A0A081PHB1_9SPHI|nr:penicillin-binding protein [Pedobacter antarcticus]KEQ30084.1 cell division protein [Pedobacter antarcticus 4BY]SFF39155.1 cell division protein FtsI (penicillin-binding protein 3) [Pedobacter antarcticus]